MFRRYKELRKFKKLARLKRREKVLKEQLLQLVLEVEDILATKALTRYVAKDFEIRHEPARAYPKTKVDTKLLKEYHADVYDAVTTVTLAQRPAVVKVLLYDK